MIEEAYCSFEVAKLLREKGFDEKCYQIYDNEGYLSFNHVGYINSEKPNKDFYALAPTHQMVMAWLREVYGLSVEIFSIKGTSNVCPVFWKGNIVKLLTQDRVFNGELVDSYEEAVEAAFKYCLENLI